MTAIAQSFTAAFPQPQRRETSASPSQFRIEIGGDRQWMTVGEAASFAFAQQQAQRMLRYADIVKRARVVELTPDGRQTLYDVAPAPTAYALDISDYDAGRLAARDVVAAAALGAALALIVMIVVQFNHLIFGY